MTFVFQFVSTNWRTNKDFPSFKTCLDSLRQITLMLQPNRRSCVHDQIALTLIINTKTTFLWGWCQQTKIPGLFFHARESVGVVLTLTGGFRQYIWCPLSQPSQRSMCSPSPFRRQIRQRAWSADFDQIILFSNEERWRKIWGKLVQLVNDSSQRSNKLFPFLFFWLLLLTTTSVLSSSETKGRKKKKKIHYKFITLWKLF